MTQSRRRIKIQNKRHLRLSSGKAYWDNVVPRAIRVRSCTPGQNWIHCTQRMASCCLLALLFWIYAAIVPTSPCGISTHIAIAHQAMQAFVDKRDTTNYRDIILKHQDAFVAGNPYPDAMYPSLCYGGKYHSVAEDTHWAPFLNATVNYIRKKYPKPWDLETEKLVAFTLGFVSHQVADVTWHSLGIQQGFLTTMGDVNFFGSFSAAHDVGDAGGDMVVSFEGDTENVTFGVNEWYVPTEDLANIYTEYYGKSVMTSEEIKVCSGIEFLGWMGEKIGGAKLFARYTKKSPFLMESIHDYFQGGIADMAAWSALLWHDTIDMLEHGTDVCKIPKSPLFIQCNASRRFVTAIPSKKRNLKNPGMKLTTDVFDGLLPSDVVIRHSERGVHFSPSSKLLHKLHQTERKRLPQKSWKSYVSVASTTDNQVTYKMATYFTETPYARLGWSLVSGNFSVQHEDLVIGAPGFSSLGNNQHGRVYIIHSDNNAGLPLVSFNVDVSADLVLDGNIENGRFGTALAVVDLNKDGIDDLAVSAPSTGANNLQYTGTVYIFYGALHQGLSGKPSLVIHGKGTYYNLGVTLLGADIDGDAYKDLVIGSPYAPVGGPQRGSVAVFLAKTHREVGAELMVDDADWMVAGQQNYSWFGYAVNVAHSGGVGILMISQPTFRKCFFKNCSYSENDTQSVGRVSLFVLSGHLPEQPLVTITGGQSFMKLGTSVAVGSPLGTDHHDEMLAISASTSSLKGYLFDFVPFTFEQSGMIYLLNLSLILERSGDLSIDKLTTAAVFEGDRSYARFGWHVDWLDVNMDGIDDLVFSAPLRTHDLTEELEGAEEGGVYAFYGGKSFPSGNATRECKDVEPCPGEKASIVFKSVEERSRLGTTFVTISTSKPSTMNMVLSAPRSSAAGFHAGAVHVLRITKD